MYDAPDDRELWPDWAKALKVPPAWTNVTLASSDDADLLVVGRDAKGRGQYVYHPRFAETRPPVSSR